MGKKGKDGFGDITRNVIRSISVKDDKRKAKLEETQDLVNVFRTEEVKALKYYFRKRYNFSRRFWEMG